MAELDDEIDAAVADLAKTFPLSPAAQRLLRIFFEVILSELHPAEGDLTITVGTVEQFMRMAAEEVDLLNPDSEVFGRLRRRRSLGPRLVDQTRMIGASDVLHIWDMIRASPSNSALLRGGFLGTLTTRGDIRMRQLGYILDRD